MSNVASLISMATINPYKVISSISQRSGFFSLFFFIFFVFWLWEMLLIELCFLYHLLFDAVQSAHSLKNTFLPLSRAVGNVFFYVIFIILYSSQIDIFVGGSVKWRVFLSSSCFHCYAQRVVLDFVPSLAAFLGGLWRGGAVDYFEAFFFRKKF